MIYPKTRSRKNQAAGMEAEEEKQASGNYMGKSHTTVSG